MIRSWFPIVCACVLGCGPNIVWYGKSPDRRHQVDVIERSGIQFVRTDGHDGRRFLGIGVEGIVWSPDSAHLAYPARMRDGWAVVTDGRIGPSWSGIGEVVWSPDSEHLAYSAERRPFWVVVHDGETGSLFDNIMKGSIVFSANSRRLGYVVEDSGHAKAVVDDQARRTFDGIGRFSFTADSKHFVYLARRADEVFVVVDDVVSPPYEAIADIVLSPVGARVAILARIDGSWHLVVDGIAGPALDRISSPIFSAPGDRIAHAARRGESEFVVLDGLEGPPFDEVLAGSVVFDATGKRLAYGARRGHAWKMIIDGIEGPEYDRIGRPVFAGATIGYTARKGNIEFAVINARERSAFDHVGEIVLSPDGRRYAFVAVKGTHTFVVHDRGHVERDVLVDETLVFGRDGKHWACLAGDATKQKFFITIDGRFDRPFDSEEFIAALSRAASRPDLLGAAPGDFVRRWIAAELARATE